MSAPQPPPVAMVAEVERPDDPHAPEPGTPEDPALAEAVAEAARHYLKRAPRGYRDDCSGFVCAVYGRAGVPLAGNTASLWEQAKAAGAVHRRKVPEVGDLVFFDNTYDRNRNGRRDDELTHVAVVMEVWDDGTTVLAHGGTSNGREELRMNLRQPDVHLDEAGIERNGYLRARYRSDKPGTPRLSGELWRGFATVDPQAIEAWMASR